MCTHVLSFLLQVIYNTDLSVALADLDVKMVFPTDILPTKVKDITHKERNTIYAVLTDFS
jgi:hypothetical protein